MTQRKQDHQIFKSLFSLFGKRSKYFPERNAFLQSLSFISAALKNASCNPKIPVARLIQGQNAFSLQSNCTKVCLELDGDHLARHTLSKRTASRGPCAHM